MKKRLLLFISGAMICSSFCTNAQNISTIAGTATPGFSGDGAAATAAQLNNPGGVAVDRMGNVYVADNANNRVRKITAAGIITTVAGKGTAGWSGDGGAATAAELKRPTNVAVDVAGNLYISDADNARIRKVTPAGIISTYAGTGSLGSSGDGGPATDAKLYQPAGLFVDASSNLYIADIYNHKIRKVDAAGVITMFAGIGTLGFGGNGGSAAIAYFNNPTGVAKDAAGNAYIADKGNHIIRKMDPMGIISTFAGKDTSSGYSGDGGPATDAKLKTPTSVKVDAANNVYIMDYGNNVVRKVTPAGTISTIAGIGGMLGSTGDGGPATAAKFTWASDVALDTAGNIYIADQGNSRIRKIQIATTSINTVTETNSTLTLFPNPGSGAFTIELPKVCNDVVVTIEDITGRIVEVKSMNGKEKTLKYSMAQPVSGLYLVKVYSEDAVYLAKLRVQ